MNLDNMSRTELFKLYGQVSEKLGFYEMVTISLNDVTEHLEQMLEDGRIDAMPSESQIKAACNFVWKSQDGEDWLACVEWAAETASEFTAAEKVSA
jgi:hypothetical protein